MTNRWHCGHCGETIELIGHMGKRTRAILEHRRDCHDNDGDQPRAGVLEDTDRTRGFMSGPIPASIEFEKDWPQ